MVNEDIDSSVIETDGNNNVVELSPEEEQRLKLYKL